jgi:hypothetical protein
MWKTLTKLMTLLGLSVLMEAGVMAAEIFQWTDARGILHFTDNPYSIPETVRNSSMLIVRHDLPDSQSFPTPFIKPPAPPIEIGQTDKTNGDAGRSPSPVITYAPREVTIIVVNSNTRLKRNPCKSVIDCRPAFRPDFSNRQYIHPSAFSGGSRQYVRP